MYYFVGLLNYLWLKRIVYLSIDGRFNTLSDVIDHYSHGVQNHPNLVPKFRFNGHTKKLNITEHEKAALIPFLKH